MTDTPKTIATANRRLDVRSSWVVPSRRIAFGIGVAASLISAGYILVFKKGADAAVNQPMFFLDAPTALVMGLGFTWLVLTPLAGRFVASLEAFVAPIYCALVRKPEHFEEIYGRPLPRTANFKKSANRGR